MNKLSNNKRSQSLLQLALFIGIAIFANILGSVFYTYFDLTEEGRFTLTEPTRKMLNELDEVVYIEILLDGEFPAGFKRLQRAVQETLDDFRSESGYIEYEFVNPNDGTVEEINKRREELMKDGIVAMNLFQKDVEGNKEQIVYTWAKVYYKNRMVPVDFFEEKSNGGSTNSFNQQEEIINNSVGMMEYNFANAIQKLQSDRREIIAFTTGHGELEDLERKDLVRSLRQYFEVGVFNIDSTFYIDQMVDVLIIADPKTAFSERDKFIIDQYVMNGGKVIWLIDKLNVSLDSLRGKEAYVPKDRDLNLDDILFKYGARINPDLVLDMQCTSIPQVIDGKGTLDLFKWVYHPVVLPKSKHPVVKSLDGINLFFPSTIDTVKTKTPVKKTVLLASSDNSRIQFNTSRISFDILRYEPDPEKFNKKNLPVAVMLEGEFSSLFENRVTEQMLAGLDKLDQEFKIKSTPTRMMVVSDGDIAKNAVNPQNGQVMPLGYNRFERYQFANSDFLLNAVEYLRDEEGIIEARGKEVKLRLMDTVKAKAEKTKWQLINILLPLVFLALFGIGYIQLRKRKYAR